MATQSYKLSEKDQTIQSALRKYIERDYFCDVTLVSDDYQKFPAHKLVLAAHSSVLETLLLNCTQPDTSHTVLHIRGFSGCQVQKLLQLFYHGGVTIEDSQISDFVKLAIDLKIQMQNNDSEVSTLTFSNGLAEKGSEKIVQKIKLDNTVLSKNNVTLSLSEDEILNTQNVNIKKEKKSIIQSEGSVPSVEQPVVENEEEIIINNPEFEYDSVDKIVEENQKDTRYIKVKDSTITEWECPMCDEIFPRRRLLCVHVRTHVNKADFKCKICSNKYTDKYRLEIHFYEVHKKMIRFQCTRCEFKCATASNINQHHRNYHQEPRFACDECESMFKTQTCLKGHRQAMHGHEGGIETFKCELCDAVLKGKCSLRAHMKGTHQLIKYPCSRCPYQAPSTSYLKQHEAGIHDGLKHECKSCDYKGFTKVALKEHIKVEHEGQRFYCDECTLVVRRELQLKRHKAKKHGSLYKIRKYNLFKNQNGGNQKVKSANSPITV